MTTESDQSMDLISTQSVSVVKRLSSLFSSQIITNDEELSCAGEALSQIVEFLKRIEKVRISLVKPLNDHVSSINKRLKSFTEPISREDGRIRNLMSKYRAVVESKRQEEYQASLKQVKEEYGDNFPIPEIVAPIPLDTAKSISTSGGGSINFMTVWDYVVEDLNQIPKKYFILDEALISKLIRAGEREIPGLKIFAKQVPVVRR